MQIKTIFIGLILAISLFPVALRAENLHSNPTDEQHQDFRQCAIDGVRHIFGIAGYKPPDISTKLSAAADLEADKALDEKEVTHRNWHSNNLRRALRKNGLSDYQVRGGIVIANDREKAKSGLLQWVEAHKDILTTHFGIGISRYKEKYALAIILIRRMVRLDPLPEKAPLPSRIAISGSVQAGAGKPLIFVTAPGGKVLRHKPMVIASGSFSQMLRLDKPGRHDIEVVIKGKHGPIVAALTSIIVGTGSGRSSLPSFEIPHEASTDQAAEAVLDWTNNFRHSYGLALLSVNEKLKRIATDSLERFEAGKELRHIDARSSHPEQRMKEAGLRPLAYGENMGRGKRLDSIIVELTDSPSHRRNLLSPHFTHIGLGLGQDEESGRWRLVQLFARLPENGIRRIKGMAKIPDSFWSDMHGRRMRSGLRPITVERGLSSMANNSLRSFSIGGKIDTFKLKAQVEDRAKRDPNRAVRMVAVLDVSGYEELAQFSGFRQSNWTLLGLAVAAKSKGGLLALIMLGEGDVRNLRKR